jgi:hypothetical protein
MAAFPFPGCRLKKRRIKHPVRSALTCDCFFEKNDVKNPVPTDSPPAPAPIEEVFVRVLFHNAFTITPFSAPVKRFFGKKTSIHLKTG